MENTGEVTGNTQVKLVNGLSLHDNDKSSEDTPHNLVTCHTALLPSWLTVVRGYR